MPAKRSTRRIQEVPKETVKALSWKLLYGNYRKTIGAEKWDELAAKVGAPDVVKTDQMEDVPMEPLNAMCRELDRLLGRGTGSEIDAIAQRSVAAWANFNKNLVKQLHGDPAKMMEIFATEVHPFFLNDPKASRLIGDAPRKALRGADGGIVMELPKGLDTGFKIGLLRGFVALTGAKADVEAHEDGRTYTVTWSLPAKRGNRVALLANAVRAPFLTATIIPVLVGWALSWYLGDFTAAAWQDWTILGLAMTSVAFFHFGTNSMNDYFDHRSGADEANYTPTPFSGGSRVIQRGLLEPKVVRNLAWTCFGIGTVLGVGLVLATQIWVLAAFGLAGFLVGYLYTAPPIRLAHRGLGELATAFGFGPLIVVGTWVAFHGSLDTALWGPAWLASVPVALLVAAILYVNQFPDAAGDAAVGKKTLVVRLPDAANITLFAFLVLGAYAAVVAGVVVDLLPTWSLVTLLTAPLALWTVRKVAVDHDHAYKLIPANAATILGLHLGTGVLLVGGLVTAVFV